MHEKPLRPTCPAVGGDGPGLNVDERKYTNGKRKTLNPHSSQTPVKIQAKDLAAT
jgi:hypothetical protein